MTVRVGTGSAAVDPSALRVAGVEPVRIMLGTGSTAVEVWRASVYPASATWSSTISTSLSTKASHTIAEAGSFLITHSVPMPSGAGTVTANIVGPWGTTSGSASTSTSIATTTRTLAVGNVINFQARCATPGSFSASGTWSIVKQS